MAEKSSETATEDNVAPPGAQAPVEHQKEFEIVEWFKNKIKESRVTFVVYYRGFWWPYCKVINTSTLISFLNLFLKKQNYLKEFAKLFEEFKDKDVAIFAVCAEPLDQAERMEKELQLPFKVRQHLSLCSQRQHYNP